MFGSGQLSQTGEDPVFVLVIVQDEVKARARPFWLPMRFARRS